MPQAPTPRPTTDRNVVDLTKEEAARVAAEPGAAPPVPAETATLQFLAGYQMRMEGHIRPGGQIRIEFAPERLPTCRDTHNGFPAWGLTAFAKFHPGGQYFEGPLTRNVGGPGVFPTPTSVPFELAVPQDARQVEMWFENRGISQCVAWDSRYGANYWFDILPEGATTPGDEVIYRAGAVPSLETVNVLSDRVVNSPPEAGTGLRLAMTAWVHDIAYRKNAWIDVHAYDSVDRKVEAKTLSLAYKGRAGGGGQALSFNGILSTNREARKLEYRLYCQVAGQVFSDGLLHLVESA